MRKYLCFYIISILLICCNKKLNNDKELISSFINEVIFSKDLSNIDLSKFLAINKKKFIKDDVSYSNIIISENIKSLNQEIQKGNKQFEIFSELELKKLGINSTFIFKDYSKVYHLIVEGNIVTSFIVENGKIISFFYNFIKNKDQNKTPLLLN